MNENYSEPILSETSGAGAPVVKWLLGLNVGIFLLQTTLVSPDTIYANLGLDPASFPAKWWTAISYMFVHAGVMHIGMNMVTLWMFGTRLEEAWASRTFLYFYLWCGAGGAAAHLLFGGDAGLVGASAAVSGVLMAYAFRWPEERVYLFGFFPTRSRWLVAWMIGINILIGLSAQTLIGWKAHLGGLAFGWLFLQARSPDGVARVGRWASALPEDPEEMPRAVPRSRSRVSAGKSANDFGDTGHVESASPRNTGTDPMRRAGDAARLNEILDKISQSGLDSLSAEERGLLQDASRQLKGI